jgi:hypothetical protein
MSLLSGIYLGLRALFQVFRQCHPEKLVQRNLLFSGKTLTQREQDAINVAVETITDPVWNGCGWLKVNASYRQDLKPFFEQAGD